MHKLVCLKKNISMNHHHTKPGKLTTHLTFPAGIKKHIHNDDDDDNKTKLYQTKSPSKVGEPVCVPLR